jgi:hypothetical protein
MVSNRYYFSPNELRRDFRPQNKVAHIKTFPRAFPRETSPLCGTSQTQSTFAMS